jgi:hypothetical protein
VAELQDFEFIVTVRAVTREVARGVLDVARRAGYIDRLADNGRLEDHEDPSEAEEARVHVDAEDDRPVVQDSA